jgi:hypothetical protein
MLAGHAQTIRLLAERENDGILVQLYWDDGATSGDDVILCYPTHAAGARSRRVRRAIRRRTRSGTPNVYAPAESREAA